MAIYRVTLTDYTDGHRVYDVQIDAEHIDAAFDQAIESLAIPTGHRVGATMSREVYGIVTEGPR